MCLAEAVHKHANLEGHAEQKAKTHNRCYSPVVAHLSTDRPVRSLSTGERTEFSVVCDLCSYVLDTTYYYVYNPLTFAP